MSNFLKLFWFSCLVFIVLFPMASRAETADPLATIASPMTWVCNALSGVGLPCGQATSSGTNATLSPTATPSTNSAKTTTTSGNKQSLFGFLFGSLFGFGSGSSSTQTATIIEGFGGKVNRQKDAIILVRVPGSNEVYRILGGKKFLIPNSAGNTVFDSYEFNASDIQTISRSQLQTFPRVKLVTVIGTNTKTAYYLTESGMVRLIPNKEIFDSYADVDQDIVVINAAEFSLYPKNQYVYNQDTLAADRKPQVYLITPTTKQAVSYAELGRLGVLDAMIAPINQREFDYYKTVSKVTNRTTTPRISTQYN